MQERLDFKTHMWVKRHVGAALSSHSLPLVCLQGKRLPAYLSADAEEGEVSDDDSADEIEDDFKLKSSNVRIIYQCNVTHCMTSGSLTE